MLRRRTARELQALKRLALKRSWFPSLRRRRCLSNDNRAQTTIEKIDKGLRRNSVFSAKPYLFSIGAFLLSTPVHGREGVQVASKEVATE